MCFLRAIPLLLGAACYTNWTSAPTVDPRLVARALSDTPNLPPERVTPEAIADLKPPTGLRPCCLFGMDLKAKIGAAPIPVYQIENIRGPHELGPHGYDKGNLERERNGLVYTCRGGFIDIAHVRDNADRTLYLAMQLARRLPEGFTLELPAEATARRVVVQPLPSGLLQKMGRWTVATTLAQWINFQLSVWHEITTGFGWDSIKGFSEKVSAFSPEDLYSNVVGERLAAGVVRNHEIDSRRTYDRAMDAWIQEALRRLGAVSRADGRATMAAVDGIYWDSRQRAPDNKMVLRRSLNITSPLYGWRVVEARPRGSVNPALKAMCAHQPAPLGLSVPERLGDEKIDRLVTVVFDFQDWIPQHFPVPVRKGTTLTQADFGPLIEGFRTEEANELGPGFDQPGPLPEAIPTPGPLTRN